MNRALRHLLSPHVTRCRPLKIGDYVNAESTSYKVRRILRDETDRYDAVVEAEWMMGPPITVTPSSAPRCTAAAAATTGAAGTASTRAGSHDAAEGGSLQARLLAPRPATSESAAAR